MKYQALATATYVSNMWLIKLSIGLFLFRLAARRRYQYILGISIAVVGIWSLVLFFWNVFQCSPVQAQWDYTILEKDPKAHCVSVDEIVNAAYALSALTILSDWLYALLPIPMIWHVKMTIQAKWSVVGVLGLGVFASIATLIRLGFLADITDTSDILRKFLCFFRHTYIIAMIMTHKINPLITNRNTPIRRRHRCHDMDPRRARDRHLSRQPRNHPTTPPTLAYQGFHAQRAQPHNRCAKPRPGIAASTRGRNAGLRAARRDPRRHRSRRSPTENLEAVIIATHIDDDNSNNDNNDNDEVHDLQNLPST